MPKDFFRIANCTRLSDLKPAAKIHVIGVAGVAMAQLAVTLSKKGFQVSGSDKSFWEPMGSILRQSSVRTYLEYKRENVPLDADLVIIGNAISYGNEEVSVVEENSLKYTGFPMALYEAVIRGKHSIVVTGTHGKTTTTALCAHILNCCSEDPSYFIGGAAQDLPESLHSGAGQYCVVEGDEYDSVFFAKVPKFTFYKPNTCIVNAIEFDHADIYADVEVIKSEFDKLVRSMGANDTAICATDFAHVAELVKKWRKEAACKIVTFGENSGADVLITNRIVDGMSQTITIKGEQVGELELQVPMPGSYNAKNALAAFLGCKLAGLSLEKISSSISSFKRVKRRQEIRFDAKGITLVEDFAHHPTAVWETLKGIKESFPSRRIWAVFEPRSNTSRRKVFQQDYIKAFTLADRAILSNVEAKSIDSGHELLEVSALVKDISSAGTLAVTLQNAQEIQSLLESDTKPGDVIVIMSNGAFGGLIESFQQFLIKTL